MLLKLGPNHLPCSSAPTAYRCLPSSNNKQPLAKSEFEIFGVLVLSKQLKSSDYEGIQVLEMSEMNKIVDVNTFYPSC